MTEEPVSHVYSIFHDVLPNIGLKISFAVLK